MHKFLYIVLIAFFPLCAHAENGEPLYIVDGLVGVNASDLPKDEEIEDITVVSPQKAVEIYGERAKFGVKIITTKEFERQLREEESPKCDEQNETNRKGNKYLAILYIVLVICCFLTSFFILKLIAKVKNILERWHIIKKSPYSPGSFDSNGLTIRAVDNPRYYIIMAFWVILAAFFVFLIVSAFTGGLMGYGVYVMAISVPSLFVLILCIIAHYKKKDCFLTIDKDGIRGVYSKSEGWYFFPKFNKFDVSWKQIEKAKITHIRWGRSITVDEIAFSPYKSLKTKGKMVSLELFSTSKVVDSVNYFYALSQQNEGSPKIKQPSLVKPLSIEEDYTLRDTISNIFLGILGLYLLYLAFAV